MGRQHIKNILATGHSVTIQGGPTRAQDRADIFLTFLEVRGVCGYPFNGMNTVEFNWMRYQRCCSGLRLSVWRCTILVHGGQTWNSGTTQYEDKAWD